MRRGWRAGLAVVLVAATAQARVAPTSLEGLVVSSDVIVYARVDRVETIEGVRVPVLRVERTLMGPEAKEWVLLLTSTWTCDISGAPVGERGLYFLQPYRKGPEDTLAVPIARFQDRVAARGLGRARSITHFGRGRMPLRVVNGEERLAFYKWDVALPPDLEDAVVETPNKKDSAWERSVPLQAVVDWVERYIAEDPDE